MNNKLLTIKNLTVKNLLKKINITINKNQIHLLLGKNGSGKTSLVKTIMGYPDYKVTNGKIIFLNKNINNKNIVQRSKLGIFLAHQNPPEIEGLNMFYFLKTLYENKTEEKIPIYEFKKIFNKKIKELNINTNFSQRNLNENFSGGEKKKSELMQMAILEPKLIILDEIDSGLDIDAFQDIVKFLNNYKLNNKNSSFLIISHNLKINKYFDFNKVHIMKQGEIIKSGTKNLIKEINNKGFKNL